MGIKKFIFGSSSSVYGVNPNLPWSEDDYVLKPISPYASTKVSAELLGHVYAHLYQLQFIALRFFTVYGPRQRPDLAIHKFAKLMLAGKKIPVYGDGSSSRDYTFVGDIVKGIVGAIAYDQSRYEIINLGNNRTVSLMEMIKSLEQVLEVKANLEFMPNQPGDVSHTFARIDKAKALLGYAPATDFITGLEQFRDWLIADAAALKS
jgi:UDP-glucuronate 4-epimerase